MRYLPCSHLPSQVAVSTYSACGLAVVLLGFGLGACDDRGGWDSGVDGLSQPKNVEPDAYGSADGVEGLSVDASAWDGLSFLSDAAPPSADATRHFGGGEPAIPDVAPACGVYHPRLLGHRGVAWNHVGNPYPENTMLSAVAALSMGADGVEIDVTKTKDGVVVLAHENSLSYEVDGITKTSCTGKITS